MNKLTSDRSKQAYVAIGLISLIPNLILIPIPYSWLKVELSNGWNIRSIFMCFASAGLLGDVLLHTLPHLLGGENHSHSDHHVCDHIDDAGSTFSINSESHHQQTCSDSHGYEREFYNHFGMERSVFITLVVIGGFLTFFLSEKLTLSLLCGGEEEESSVSDHGHSHSHAHDHSHSSTPQKGKSSSSESASDDRTSLCSPNARHKHSSAELNMSITAYLNLIADSLHNFTDGLAIGASFSGGQGLGLATFLSIICHELPHEIGDFTILIQSGFS